MHNTIAAWHPLPASYSFFALMMFGTLIPIYIGQHTCFTGFAEQ